MSRPSRATRESLAIVLALVMTWTPLVLAAQIPASVMGTPKRNEPKPEPEDAQRAQPAPEAAKPQAAAAQTSATASSMALGGLNLQNVSLTEVIDFLARRLKINYIVDPRVKGSVTINTYGEVKDIEPRALLDTLLRINGAAMVQTGNLYRIVPLADLPRMPLRPQVDSKSIPDDDQAMLNLIFLKFIAVDELAKLIGEFLGPDGRAWSYPPANLLLVLDSRRNMGRLMELIAMFDSDTLAQQRVRLFEMQYSKPSDIAKEMENLLKSISLSKELATVRFIPVDRINTLIAVAPNPGAFVEVEKWLQKLDVKQRVATGANSNYVYRVKYGIAPMLAMAIMALYGDGMNGMMGMMSMMGMMGMGGYGMGGYGGGGGYGMGMGMGMGGLGMGGYGMGGYGMGGMGGGYGMGMGGMMGYGNPPGMYSNAGYSGLAFAPVSGGAPAIGTDATRTGATGQGTDQTGTYLGSAAYGSPGMYRGPKIVPNPFDNTLLIQATPQEYEGVLDLLKNLDVPPRQVLLEAKIYEVELTGAFANGVEAYFRKQGSGFGPSYPGNGSNVGIGSDAVSLLTFGSVVGQSRELLAFLNSQEQLTRSRVLSAPAILATDSIPATINVGTDIPVLTSQAVTGVQSSGSSVFANTISTRSTGVTLGITARISPSGIVTLIINQEVSSPGPPPAGGVNSSTFSRKSVQTQVTVQDGDTIAIGGIISESNGFSQKGLPGLARIPIVGGLLGSLSTNRSRSELIIFMTPRVIYDTNEVRDASDELKMRLRKLQKYIKE